MQRMDAAGSHRVHLHTKTERRPVQTMLWRLVFGVCSWKHFCDLRFFTLHLHFLTLVQMTSMNVKGEIQMSNETILFPHIVFKSRLIESGGSLCG